MDPDRWRRVEQVLDAALGRGSADWDAVLDERCGGDAELRREVETLLRRVAAAEGFLDSPPAALAAAVLTEAQGDADSGYEGRRIGAYRLVREIGRGGMSRVFLAERADGQYAQHVAVKLLRAGLDSELDRERFRAERQILASMDHPNIARLLDGGVVDGERPYLVLELVQGRPIDEHCAGHELSLEDRVRLFLTVADATQYAHGRLVVHRDLKPSNILVTAEGTVKLLDFGLAKLLGAEPAGIAAPTTRLGQRWMTPEYAAPEQIRGEPVTALTDVYQLGAVLYQLLTGAPPFGARGESLHALEQKVLNEAPPTPSGRFASGGAGRTLLGDLDAILLRALRKEPERRYPTAAALAEDLRRALDGRPVLARPDGAGYRLRKFLGRHRVPVTAAALAAFALVAATVYSVRQRGLAEERRDFALEQLSRAEAINDLNAFLLTDAAPGGRPFTVGDLLARAESVVGREQAETETNRVEMLAAIGTQYLAVDEDARARSVLERAYALARGLDDPAPRARAACALGRALSRLGEHETAGRLFAEGVALVPGTPEHVTSRIRCLLARGEAVRAAGRYPESLRDGEAAWSLAQRAGLSPSLRLEVLMDLAAAFNAAGRRRESDSLYRAAHAQLVALGRQHTQTAVTLYSNWALALRRMGQPLGAEPLYREAIRISSTDQRQGGVSPIVLDNYARVLQGLGRSDEALAHTRRAYDEGRRTGNEVAVNQALLTQAEIFRDRGDVAAMERALDEVEPRLRQALPPEHYVFALLHSQRAFLAHRRGRADTARALADHAVELAERSGDNAGSLMLALRRRAEQEIEMGDGPAAVRDAERALALARNDAAAGVPSATVGLAHLALGRAYLLARDLTRARRALDSARAHLPGAVGSGHPRSREADSLVAEALSGDR